jgi:hypothetical protein
MRAIVTTAILLLTASPLVAQSASRMYVGAGAAVDGGSRGRIPGGAVPSASGLVGIRLSDAWSLELEIERGFRTTGRTDEAVFVSFAPPNSSREEIERLGIRARFERTQKAGPGFAAHVMWRSREPGRVNVGVFGGVAARAYDSRVVRTILFVPPEVTLPANHPDLLPSDETRRMTGGGPTGGLVVFVRVSRSLTIAPEVRYTHGLITDDPYRVFRMGVRAMWLF